MADLRDAGHPVSRLQVVEHASPRGFKVVARQTSRCPHRCKVSRQQSPLPDAPEVGHLGNVARTAGGVWAVTILDTEHDRMITFGKRLVEALPGQVGLVLRIISTATRINLHAGKLDQASTSTVQQRHAP